ncbi:unnamed protein product [Polarella glacialis]|uniref:Uncharacterized protein n=1 Tax=Polarella glacialis TaxID=89957 RepID=A0A813DAK8_POLGL|nr:unnamed protein product [Polarella glacialis]
MIPSTELSFVAYGSLAIVSFQQQVWLENWAWMLPTSFRCCPCCAVLLACLVALHPRSSGTCYHELTTCLKKYGFEMHSSHRSPWDGGDAWLLAAELASHHIA